MATENKKYIPTLRFPEFQNDGEWALTPIGKYYKVQGGFAFKSSEFKKSGIPIIRISNIPNDGIYIETNDSVYYDTIVNEDNFLISKGDLLIAMSGATTGKTAVYNQIGKAYLNQRVGLFKSTNSHNYYPFICQWVKSNYFYAQLKRTLAAGAQPNISSIDIESFIWAYPNGNNSFAEQKKIADCLSSLDKYIEATKRKLELLKEHKKGLMQRLFPAKGKTTPELRFSEFKNDGEWVEKKVRNIFDQITRGCVLPVSETRQSPDDTYKYPVYSSQTANNGLMGYYNKFLYKNAITWTTDGANAGTVMLRRGEFFCTNVYGVLISHRGYANGCISEIIATHAKEHVSYVGNPKLMNNVMGEIEICIPPTIDEQIKIADCLYKVDQIISSHEKKIKSLELHKRGLIQQLFPKL